MSTRCGWRCQPRSAKLRSNWPQPGWACWPFRQCRQLPKRLARRCDPATLGFATTAELADVDLMVAQERAGTAIGFAADVTAPGFNLFVVGRPDVGRPTIGCPDVGRHVNRCRRRGRPAAR